MITENKTGYTQLYFITITLKPILYRLDSFEQYRISYQMIHMILGNEFEYILIPEFTKCYNIHYHGFIRGPMLPEYNRRPFQYHIQKLFRNNKLIGFIDIDPVKDFDKSGYYMIKDIEQSYAILGLLYSENIAELNTIGYTISDLRYFKQAHEKMTDT